MKIPPGRASGRNRTASSLRVTACSLRVVALLVLLITSVGVITSTSAASAQDQDIASIDLDPLRSSNGASTVPYRVTVVSDRAIEGILQIRVVDQNISFEYPLALAANTEVSQLIGIPSNNGFGGPVEVNLLVDGTSVAGLDDFLENGNFGSDFAAGVLGLEVAAEQSQVTPPVGTVTNIEIDDLRILQALDIVVSSPAALRTLTPDEQAQLLTWVGSGRRLVVADEPGSIDDLLPAQWQGTGATVLAGVGEISFVGTDWDEALPGPVSTATSGEFFQFGASNTALASDAGFRVPSIGLLTIVLLGYLLVIGPITFAVLGKMNRQALAWLAIPVLAVLFGVVIVGAGRVLISGRNDAYASVVTVTPAGSQISSTLLIADDGNQTIDLPTGWSVSGNGSGEQFFGGGGAGSQLAVAPSRTTTDLSFNIDTGSAAVVRVNGHTADVDMPFAFADLEISEDDLTGTITNQSGTDLNQVAVFVGSNAMYVEELGDGETLAFTVELQPAANQTFPEMREWDVLLDFQFGFDEPELDEDGFVNGASWLRWRLDNYGAAVPDGMITAVGWSRDLEEYSLIGGRGRTALVQHADLPFGEQASSGQIRRTIPRSITWQDIEGFGRDFGEGVPTQFIRPAGSATDGLAIETPNDLEELAVWVDGEWRYLDLENHPDARSIAVPEEAWENDRLTALFGFAGFGFEGNAGDFQPRMVEPDVDTRNGEFAPAGERSRRVVGFEDEFGGGFGNEFGPEFINLEETIERASREDVEYSETGVLDNSYDTYSVLLEPGDDVTVTLRSNDFDALLIINTEDGDLVAENDDADGGRLGLDSQIQFQADEWGVYVIEARPLFGPAFGDYSLNVDIETTGDAQLGWTAEGFLDAGEAEEWPVRVNDGEIASVLFTSEFTPAVAWLDAEGNELATDGDEASFTASEDGTYTLRFSAAEDQDAGRYVFDLTVEDS